MKNKFWLNLFTLLLVTSLFASGCSTLSTQLIGTTSYSKFKVAANDCNYGGEVRSVEALDAYSVKFTLCKPDAAFPSKLTSPIFAVQDKAFLDSHQGGSSLMTYQTNGTGPFYVAKYSSAAPIQLKASDTYWGVPPRLTDVYFRWISEADLADPKASMEIGDVFNSVAVSPLASALSTSSAFSDVSHPSMNVVYVGFNNSIKPMDNVNVRKAIATMLNRTLLVQSYLPEGSEVATQLIPSNVYPGRTNTLKWYDIRPKDAMDALAEINYDYNQTINLAYVETPSKYIKSPGELAAAIQSQLAEINLNVVLKPMSQYEFDRAMAAGTEMMFIDSFQALYNDGAAFYELPLVRQEKRFGNPYTSLQQELQDALSYSSVTTRQEKFDTLNLSFKNQIPLVPLGHVTQVTYYRSTLSGVSANAYFENYEELYNPELSLQIYAADRAESLWPADETNYDTFRITKLIYDTLVTEGYGTAGVQPSLADSWESNTDLTEWTFYLRYNIKFTNNAELDANDVVASFAAMWDASSVNHIGRSREYVYFRNLFGDLLNQPE